MGVVETNLRVFFDLLRSDEKYSFKVILALFILSADLLQIAIFQMNKTERK